MTEAQRENPSRRLRVFTQSRRSFSTKVSRQIEKTRHGGSPDPQPQARCALCRLAALGQRLDRRSDDALGSAWHLCLRVKRRMGRRSCRPHPNH